MSNTSTVSGLWPELEKIKEDLHVIAEQQNVSEVLLLTTLKDFCDRRLTSVIDGGL